MKKAAGLRTLTLVAAGSAVFVLAAVQTNPSEGVRMMAGITTGVGFLGAGVIMRNRGEIFGLTTAASVWMSSALGVTAALGRFELTAVGVALTIIVLYAFSFVPFDRFRQETHTYTVTWAAGHPFDEAISPRIFKKHKLSARHWSVERAEDSVTVTWLVYGCHADQVEMTRTLEAEPAVIAFTSHE